MEQVEGVIVVGPHRSGTSAMARAIQHLGPDPGAGPFIDAHESNPRGHWELQAIVGLHDAVLEGLRSDWASPPPPSTLAAERSWMRAAHVERARGILSNDLTVEPWLWKDPRGSLLLPLWWQALGPGASIATVLMVRQARTAADSLARRDGFAPGYGLALWERYLRSALTALAGRPTAVVSYERLVTDPEGTIGWIAGWLGAGGEAVERAVGTIEPSLNRSDGTGLPVPLTPQQERLADLLDGLSGSHPALEVPDLGEESPNLQVAFDEHQRMLRHERYVDWLRTEMDRAASDAQREQDRLRLELAEALDARDQLHHDLAGAERRLREVETRVDRLLLGPLRRRLGIRPRSI